MSETRDGNRPGDKNKTAETIIDAKVEPIGRLRRPAVMRVVILLVAAIIVSVAVAVGWQLWSTGRLDLAALTGRLPASEPAPTPPKAPPARPVDTKPGAIATAMQPATDALGKRIDDLDRRLSALSDGLDRLEQVPAGQTTATVSPQQLSDLATGLQGQMQSLMQARMQDIGKRLDALDRSVAALQSAKEAQAADRIVVQQRMDEFDARLKAAVDNRAAALRAPIQQILAWSELRDRARRGLPFAAQMAPLSALAEKAGGDSGNSLRDAVATIQPFADAGVPTLSTLIAGFPDAAGKQAAAFRAPAPDAATKPWWQRAFDKVAGLVSVRRVDTVTDTATPEGRLASAEAALHAGDISAATAALDGMTLVPAMADWRHQAGMRLKLDAALDACAVALQTWFASP